MKFCRVQKIVHGDRHASSFVGRPNASRNLHLLVDVRHAKVVASGAPQRIQGSGFVLARPFVLSEAEALAFHLRSYPLTQLGGHGVRIQSASRSAQGLHQNGNRYAAVRINIIRELRQQRS